MKAWFFWGALVALTGGLGALPADEAGAPGRLLASPRHGEWVQVPVAGGAPVKTWVVYPERSGPAPVVLVIHEIFGLTDWARAVADELAAEGFLAVAPDFVGDSAALGPEGARAAIGKLDPQAVVTQLNAAARWATDQPSATKTYGVVGFCWGGGMSYLYATAQPGLAAAVGYYGTAPDPDRIAAIRAPVLAFYGGNDNRVTSTLPGFQGAMKGPGQRFESAVYPGAGHAFLRQQSGQNGANLTAGQQAWPRTIAFLKAELEGKKTAAIEPLKGLTAADDCCGDD